MTGLTHVRWLTDDLAGMVAFYRDVLGFRVVVDVPGTYAELDTGAARIGLYLAQLMSAVLGERVATASANDVVLGIQVDDVDATARRLQQNGVMLTKPPHDQPAWRLRVAHLRDPAGHLLELWAPLANN
jgi:lactoylglutathione lyase